MEKIVITKDILLDKVTEYFNSEEFDNVLDTLIMKNKQYDDSWQTLGVWINFADILDKCKRAVVYKFTPEEYLRLLPGKFDEIIFDLFVRCLLTMVYRENLINNIEES